MTVTRSPKTRGREHVFRRREKLSPHVRGPSLLLPFLLFALSACQTLIPPPDREIVPPPLSAYRRTSLATGVELLEYQGPETRVSGEAAYVSGSGGSFGFGITLPTGRKQNRPRIQASAIIVDLTQAELVPIARPVSTRRGARAYGDADTRAGATDGRTPGGADGRAEADPGAGGAPVALSALRPSLFLAENPGLLAAINATPFDPNVLSVGEPVRPVGVVIVDGVELSGYNGEYAALYLPTTGRPWIAPQPPGSLQRPQPRQPPQPAQPPQPSLQAGAAPGAHEEAAGGREIESALGGYFIVLSAGEVRGPRRLRAARSAIGFTGDRRRAILLAVAGDSPGRSVGLTAAEVGLWLKSLGAEEGLLLDGGGSTSMAVRLPLEGAAREGRGSGGAQLRSARPGSPGPAGEVRMTITPSWGPTLGVERPVATLLAVREKKE